MARIMLNGREIEAVDGAPLVEVVKDSGQFISNLCYIDGLPPYAGCRTCIVEIEGARGFQLSCTSKVTDGMIVRTETPELRSTRQAVLSLILSYHSDRCLTCHRIVKCKPGDTCLRDDVVTHRCLTCSKNYRCELQTTCEMLEMAGFEPWDGDGRTYYNLPQPAPDQANPFLEFDPQMCIICTRCVRACDEIRHTGAITLAGRGFSTRIAFGAGGRVDESNCDFCGACIDICPTATLMEHPNKWGATQTERWTPTTCTQCSVGCSIFLGTKKGKGVIVKPDTAANPVSRDQLCVRGRFHYDALKPAARLSVPLIKRNGGHEAVAWDEALEFAAARIAQVHEQCGPDAIGFLASPFATTEENYLLGKIARAIVGTNSIDSSTGAVARAATGALREAFGSEVLPADMTRIAQSKTILVVADDIDSSHNIAGLRAKDAVVRGQARLVVVSALWNELNDFADVWLQPKAGHEATVAAALASAIQGESASPPDGLREAFQKAVAILSASKEEANQPLSVIYALAHFGPTDVRAITGALANIAVGCAKDNAANALFVLPPEANVWGMRDVGCSPEVLPGHRAAGEGARAEMERLWGAPLPSAAGLTLEEMIEDGKAKALVVLDDNPLMLAPDRTAVDRFLGSLDFLAVIDSVPTDTVARAHVVFPETGAWSKEGTTVSADRRILRLNETTAPRGDAQPGWRILSQLGSRLADRLRPGEIRINYAGPGEVMDEIAEVVPLYGNARYCALDSGAQQVIDGAGLRTVLRQAVAAIYRSRNNGHFTLTTSRSLYTSYEASALHSPEADRLRREDSLKINPQDAAALGVSEGDTVTLRNAKGSLSLKANITAAVQKRTLYLPIYYDGGAVTALFEADSPVAQVDVSRAGT